MLEISPDRRFLAVGTDAAITIWDLTAAKTAWHFPAQDSDSQKWCGQQFLTNSELVLTTQEGQLIVVSLATGKTVRSTRTKPRVFHMIVSLRHSTVAVFTADFVEFFDLQLRPLMSLRSPMHVKTSALDGDVLVAASQQGKIVRIDLTTLTTQTLTYSVSGTGETARLSADGRTLLVGTIEGNLLLIDARSGGLRMHLANVTSSPITAIQADSTAIYIGDRFKDLKRWDLRRANHSSRFSLPENTAE
jgi:hypothetical protein